MAEDRFRGYDRLTLNDPFGHRKLILDSLNLAVESVEPQNLMKEKLSLEPGQVLKIRDTNFKFPLHSYDKLIVIGAGKGSGAMALALESILGQNTSCSGVVIVPQGTMRNYPTSRLKILEGTHPIPSSRSVRGAEEVRRAVQTATAKSLVLCLISGGGSALMTLPAKGISLKDQVDTTTLLLKGGASIEELNCVRKHLSSVKGGQLARLANGATVLSLIISDIVGNPLGSIASGPTAPDPTTFGDALDILKDLHVMKKVPPKVLERLRAGARGQIPETPKPGDPVFERVTNFILGDNSVACLAITKAVKKIGSVKVSYLGSAWQGEARETAANLVGLLQAALTSEIGHNAKQDHIFLWGGETTVTVYGKGRGGRNQEEALSGLIKLGDEKGITVAFMGTDGIDGFSPAAGAIIDWDIFARAKSKKLSPSNYLRNNDSTTFFEKVGDSLLITGPTGTNVNDIGMAVVKLA